MIAENENMQQNLNNIAQDMVQKKQSNKWMDDTFIGVCKAIEWPSVCKTLKYTIYSMLSSSIIGSVLYLYGYGINQLIAFITK